MRKDSPSPESGGVRVVLPGAKLSLHPTKVRPALPWIILVLGAFGITGGTILAYIREGNAVHGEVSALKQANAQLRTELDDVRAVYRSQEKRIKALEGAPNAPLVVTK